MSIGNLKTYGGKGTNLPYQLKSLTGLQQISDGINANGPISDINLIKQYANDYLYTLTYYTGTGNVQTITHTGTVNGTVLTAVETLTYVNNLVDDSNFISSQLS
jgi:hypothetical protein